jgi:hypothetical protein
LVPQIAGQPTSTAIEGTKDDWDSLAISVLLLCRLAIFSITLAAEGCHARAVAIALG